MAPKDHADRLATQQLTVELLADACEQIDALARQYAWNRDETVSALVSAGAQELQQVDPDSGKLLDELAPEELSRFKHARLMQLEARYSVLNFRNYRLEHENEAQAQNLAGLMPQFDAAVERIHGLESEIRRLRALVPPEARMGRNAPFVPDQERPVSDLTEVDERVRRIFGDGSRKGASE